MRAISVLAVFAAMALPAVACNDQLFTIDGWQTSASADGRNVRTKVNVDLRYEGERPYRMIHGSVMFSDVLGGALLAVQLERDAQAEPTQGIKAEGAFIGTDSRITTIDREDVVVRTCVWSIVYDDGTAEEF